MGRRKTRNRQLARVAQRRQMERRQQHRRRQTMMVAGIVVLALLAGVGAFTAFTLLGDDDPAPRASVSPSVSPSESPSASPSEDVEPGSQTGTVEPVPGPETVACGAEVPEGALGPKPQFNAPAQVLEEGVTYTATFRTSCGDIVIELLSEEAPETVNSFVFLAEEGYFDASRVHRLDDSIDVIQGGDPTGTGTGGPGYTIPDELQGGETYPPGTLAMANAGANSGGSQFFLITGEDGHNLDGNPAYTIFGRVVEGLEIAQEILALPIQDPAAGIAGQQPADALYLEEVEITTTG
jgi:cyclophilin family peptidyl-prolyl cis-trans isomerase